MQHPIEKAAGIVGSQSALAVALGVTKAAVWQWKDPARQVPAEHCPAIERITHGEVRCEELRPDVDWGYLRATAMNGTNPSQSTVPASCTPSPR